MDAKVVGETLIRRSMSSVNLLIALTTTPLVGALIGAHYWEVPHADLRGIVSTIAFVVLLPISVVSLLVSASAREFLGLVSYMSRFNFHNELDTALGFYKDESTSTDQRVLAVVYAVFWSLFFLSISNFMATLMIGSLFF
jgi:hypothetical protein